MTHRCPTLALLMLAATAAQTQQSRPADLELRSLAANCAACHGTDSRSAPDSSVPGLAGMPREQRVAPDIHVIGDATQSAPAMPNSGYMANAHGKVAAAAVVARLSGWDVNPAPMLTNTCYSFVDDRNVVHVASVHEYVAAEKTFKAVVGSGGLSTAPSEAEGRNAMSWARKIWLDTLG
jgi:hypothetical protein